ncbi:MAG: peptide chain release factor 1 [Candidatus Omnitrophota bacterium]|nr:MAG: peptide chain release factor 1 [Candidatus Omnitrophota bacterium]
MFEALEEKRKRYKQLQGLLADPEVVKDRSAYSKYAKELSSLSDMVNKYEQYLQLQQEVEKLKKMLKEKHEAEFIDMAKAEISTLQEKTSSIKKQLEEQLLTEEPYADKNIIVEIRAGTGGLEAGLFAQELFRMYSKFAQKNNWKVDVMNTSPQEGGGIKEITFSAEGKGVYRKFKYESGTHRVQRVPVTETAGRIHTSAATVAVLPEAEEVEVKLDPKDLRIDTFRSSGRGGQHVNVTDSAVRITHLPTNIVVTCQDERSQHKNKNKAMKVLRARLLDKIDWDRKRKISVDRKRQIGTGDRSEKIRTYNFPDRRVTDHRIGLTIHKLESVLEGDLDEIVFALLKAEKKLKLQGIK